MIARRGLTALALVLSLTAPAMAQVAPVFAPEAALRPVARPLPEPPGRPLARPIRNGMDSGALLTAAEMPPVTGAADAAALALHSAPFLTEAVMPPASPGHDGGEALHLAGLEPAELVARISTRSAPISAQMQRMEEMLDALAPQTVAAVARPAIWTGLRPALRAAPAAPGRPILRPAALAVAPAPEIVAPAVGLIGPPLAVAPGRPSQRPAALQEALAERRANMVIISEMTPDMARSISPFAVGEALVPPTRSAEFMVRAASAPRPAATASSSGPGRALTSGNGLCGVPILTGRALGTVNGSGSCGVENAVEVTAIGGIALSTGLTVDCQTATALADWVSRVANPALGGAGGGLSRIEVGGGYACRGRNNQAGERLSEHAFGRAVDIMGFRLVDGTRLTVLNNWGNRALREMHRGACGIFGTVLGPDANRFHRDHFHFDTARYRSGSYCR